MHVWYLAYGSNLDETRFMRYLVGSEHEAGARNPTPPTDSRWIELPFRLTFMGESAKWGGGGVAFVWPDPAATTWFRAWRITTEQFEDVFAQENKGAIGTALPWDDLDRLPAGSGLDVGDRWYRRVHRFDGTDLGLDAPALTFTCSERGPFNPPSPAYRATIAAGLSTNPELDAATAGAYLTVRASPESRRRGR